MSFTGNQAPAEHAERDDIAATGFTQESIMEMLHNIAESGKTTVQKTGDVVTDATQKVLGTAGTQGTQLKDMPASSTGIPAVTESLQSGTKKISSIYPGAGAGHEAKDVAQNEQR